MGRIFKFVGLGCGGLIVLVLLLGGLGALIGGNEDTASKSDEEKQEAEPQDKPGDKQGEEKPKKEGSKKEEAPTVRIGETLEIGDVAWTVTNARRANELVSTFGQEPKRGDFVVVDFTFTNNGSQAATLDRVSTVLLDSQGRESEPDPDTFG